MKGKKHILGNIIIILSIIMLNAVIFCLISYFSSKKMIIPEAMSALLFLQALVCFFMIFLFWQYNRLRNIENIFGLNYVKGTFFHPKFDGIYKNNWWQIHFISREEGQNWGIPMTYIKLQWKTQKKFDESKLLKYRNMDFDHSKILEVKHITREYKDYLLLKRKWYTFNKNKINDLMELLVNISKEAAAGKTGKKKK